MSAYTGINIKRYVPSLVKIMAVLALGVILLIPLFVSAASVNEGTIPTNPGYDRDEGGYLRLRHGSADGDGDNTFIPLRAYFTSQPTSPYVVFNTRDCYRGPGLATMSVRINGAVRVNQNSCSDNDGDGNTGIPNYSVTIARPTPVLGLPGWYMSIVNVELTDVVCSNSKCRDSGEHARYRFSAAVSNGGRLAVDATPVGDTTGFSAWGSNVHTIPFGIQPTAATCSNPNAEYTQRVGVWDPDGFDTEVQLHQLTSSGWVNITSQGQNAVNGEFKRSGSSRYFEPDKKGRISSSFVYSRFKVGERYRLVIRTENGNTIVPNWPYPTIFGTVAGQCWNIRPTTTVSSPVVIVNPEGGSAVPVTWTHTADNQGVFNSDPVNLTYQWTSGFSGAASSPWNNVVVTPGSNRVRTVTLSIPADTPPGTQYCQRMTSSKTNWKNSAPISSGPVCVTVQWPPATPFFQIEGGDINSSSGSIGGMRNATNTIGAGGQLAAFARTTISGFPTANGNTNKLAFANTGPSTPGNFSSGYPSVNSLFNPVGSGVRDVNKTASSKDIPDGYTGTPVIQTSGDIYIWNDIQAAELFELGQTPMARILAGGNIYISHEVTRIDAILMAKGTIYTCAIPNGASLVKPSLAQIANQCRSNKLIINGAVSAGAIRLLRSSGGIEKNAGPAEVINYSPTAWLQALTGTGGTGSGTKYDAYSSLPPIL